VREVVEVAEVVLRAIRERKLRGERLDVPGREGEQTSITWFLDDPNSPSEVLDETGVYKIPVAGGRAWGQSVLGVDGSSRRFSTPYGFLVLATVALALGPLPLFEYPSMGYEYPVRRVLSEPFAATYESLGVKHSLIATRSPAGHPYEPPPLSSSPEEGGSSEGYTPAEVAHEVRTRLETLGLKVSVEELREGSLVILDGPLYQRPWGSDVSRNPYLRDDWRELTRERVEVLEEASRSGVVVLGSVKRLDKSRLLVRVHWSLSEALGLNCPRQENDQAEAVCLASLYVKKHGLRGLSPLLIGPLKARVSDPLKKQLGIEPPEYVYSYVVVPQLPYNGYLDVPCGVLRLEVLSEVYESEGVEVFFRALSEGFTQGPPLPIAQAFADAFCRQSSRNLFNYLCSRALTEGIDLSYDTQLAFSRAGEEYAE
jgi:hypothetical protein